VTLHRRDAAVQPVIADTPANAAVGVSAAGDSPGILRGYFAVWNQFERIGHFGIGDVEPPFMERFAPDSLTRSMIEDRARIRSFFHHLGDPVLGARPLGPILTMRPDGFGAFFEVELVRTRSIVDELVPGLRVGLYGASMLFRERGFRVVRRPPASSWNPDRLPEVTITEAQLVEFGPTAIPAYAATSSHLEPEAA
jgi:phage head maturation protease